MHPYQGKTQKQIIKCLNINKTEGFKPQLLRARQNGSKLCSFIIICSAMCLGKAVPPPTQKAQLYVFTIRILIILQIIIVVTNFVASNHFIREAVFGIFFLLVLYVMQHQLSYQIIMINIFISIYFALYFLTFFLQPIQNQQNFDDLTNMQKFTFSIAVISFVYYSLCFIFFFYPYREFKIIAYSQNPILKSHFKYEDNKGSIHSQQNIAAKQVDYDINYGNIAISHLPANNGEGNFEIQKGKGFRIG